MPGPSVQAKTRIKSRSLSAVVTRADGRIEDLGVISFYDRNPLKRWAFRLRAFLKRIF